MAKRNNRRKIAVLLLIIQLYQLIYPTASHALMSGPSQPEMQGFEPVATTQTVDPFSGDFTYNIPLLDVEGYPINISYHSGSGLEDESSWVGLGWNINPGCVNRTVRGIPDDFKGEELEKAINVKAERNTTMGTGVELRPEIFGKEIPITLGLGYTIGFNNYRGVSVGFNAGVSSNLPFLNGALGLGINSQDGADVYTNVSASLRAGSNGQNGSFTLNAGTGFNTRTGLKNITYGISYKGPGTKNSPLKSTSIDLYTSYIPIGLQNYVSVTTNPSRTFSSAVQIKGGGAIYGGYLSLMARAETSLTKTDPDGSRHAYGYLYSDQAKVEDIHDFSREKDGIYNNTLSFLPSSTMTYDVYSVSGQGTGGVFRPYRNDFATVYDPFTEAAPSETQSIQGEFGLGSLFEVGGDYTTSRISVSDGPWEKLNFASRQSASLYENTYFKQAGEMTRGNVNLNQSYYGNNTDAPLYERGSQQQLYDRTNRALATHNQKIGDIAVNGNGNERTPRANHIKILTNEEAGIADVGTERDIISHKFGGPTSQPILRNGVQFNSRKSHHIGEIVQTLPDGRRYIYGLPAMNNVMREAVFAVKPINANYNTGLVKFSDQEDSKDNKNGRDNFYSGTITPAYAHSYLLTEVLSGDYVDVQGDGVTNDDLGNYTKFSYNRWRADYRWQSPYIPDGSNENIAQYNAGYTSDKGDDKGQYVIGSKELWHLSAVEGRNQIAIFYTSERQDGVGSNKAIRNKDGSASLYNAVGNLNDRQQFKLDSIALFNKNDLAVNGANARSLKTVIFRYNYELCPGTPNSISQESCTGMPAGTSGTHGKLTLKAIYTHYGSSQKSLLSPYKFDYGNLGARNPNPANNNNYPYSFAAKNRWGGYKPPAPNATATEGLSNWEFPYVDQTDPNNDLYAGAYQLTKITLPSGGVMHIEYESDDYAYVQDKRAMQMVHVAGVGTTTAYNPQEALYADADNPYRYIYFRKTGTGVPSLSMAQQYLNGEEYLYFSFSVDLPNKKKFEQIRGYAKVEAIGECTGNPDYGYIRVKAEPAGKRSQKAVNPVTLMALNTGRFYIPHQLYPGFKDFDENGNGNELSADEVLNAYAYSAGELLSLAQNANVRFMDKSDAKYFKKEKSFIRLQVPAVTKKGGGSRVKKITLSDSWNDFNSNSSTSSGPQSSTYGQEFSYTMEDPKYGTISSGVASYEPFIGGDENPLRQPESYTADEKRMLPPIQFYQEKPLGESLYPPAMVGYSRVTVHSIHFNEGQSTQNENVNEYYTARDFPVVTDYTTKELAKNSVSKRLLSRREEVNVLQGYVVRLNDMHGKPKSQTNYLVKDGGARELITSTAYKYKTDSKGALDNNVKAVRWDGTRYVIDNCMIGKEADVTIDSRSHSQHIETTRVQPNVNTFNIAIYLIVVPTVFMPTNNDDRIFKTMVTTKVVQQYGILQSVETVDHGARTVMENVLYDAESGNVMLTRTNNEFDDNDYNLTVPAYQSIAGMGQAYQNTDYNETDLSMRLEINSQSPDYLNGYLYTDNPDRYNPGDELLVEFKGAGDQVNYNYPYYIGKKKVKLWVVGKKVVEDVTGYRASLNYAQSDFPTVDCNYLIAYQNSHNTPPSTYTQEYTNPYWKIVPTGTKYTTVLVVSPRSKYVVDNSNPPAVKWIEPLKANQLTAADVTVDPINYTHDVSLSGCSHLQYTIKYPPTPPFTSAAIDIPKFYKDLTVSVVRSGKHNNLTEPLAQFRFNTSRFHPYVPASYAGLTSDPSIYQNLLSAAAYKYSDQLSQPYADFDNIYGFNPFVLGQSDIYRLSETRIPQVSRSYGAHNRDAGKFSIPSPLSYIGNSLTLALNTAQWKLMKMLLRYSPYGTLLEDKDNNDVHSAAQLGYNNSLVTAVTYNADQWASLFENFEDIAGIHNNVLAAHKGLSDWQHSPFHKIFSYNTGTVTMPVTDEQLYTLNPNAANAALTANAHSGNYALQVGGSGLQVQAAVQETPGNQIYPFRFNAGQPYLVTLWARSAPGSINGAGFQAKTPPIDGWVKYEAETTVPAAGTVTLSLNPGVIVDDVRMMPKVANMKSFVFDVITSRLMAVLDENHYATFYEYDQEGQLVRTKKETDRGILTLQESRKSTRKAQ